MYASAIRRWSRKGGTSELMVGFPRYHSGRGVSVVTFAASVNTHYAQAVIQ